GYVHGPLTNQVVATQTVGNVLWALPDHLRSVRDWVDNGGTTVVHSVFNSFGVVVSSTGTAPAPRLGYAGYQYDAALGQYHVRARSYDPATGRFLSQDPIRQAAGDANLYRYVGNRVMGSFDPSGLAEESLVNKVVSGVKKAVTKVAEGAANVVKTIVKAELDAVTAVTGFIAKVATKLADSAKHSGPLATPIGGVLGVIEGIAKTIDSTAKGISKLVQNLPEVLEGASKAAQFAIDNPAEAAGIVSEAVDRVWDSVGNEINEIERLSQQGKLYDAARRIGNIAGKIIGELIPIERAVKGAKLVSRFVDKIKVKRMRKRFQQRPEIDPELSPGVGSRPDLHDRPPINDRDGLLGDKLRDRPPIEGGDDIMRGKLHERPPIQSGSHPTSGDSITKNMWSDTKINSTRKPGLGSRIDTEMPDTHIPDTLISDTHIPGRKLTARTDGASNFARKADPASPIKRKMCFVAGTLVATEHGQRAIESIKAGESVYAFDFSEGRWVSRHVTETHVSDYEGVLVTIATDRGEVTATAYHPFWVIEGHDLANRPRPKGLSETEDEGLTLEGRWVNSHDLMAGDVVFNQTETSCRIVEINQRYEQSTRVYNLSVDTNPSFMVGNAKLLVHNTGRCGPDGSGGRPPGEQRATGGHAANSAAAKIANRSMTKSEWQSFYRQLRTHSREAAADIRATVTSRHRGPVVSTILDARTGQAFSSKNYLGLPENLHPILSSRVQQLHGTTDIAALRRAADVGGPRWPYSTPGAHAEVYSLNQALWAREVAGLPVDLNELWMVNRWLSNSAGAAPRCGYCNRITRGVNVLTD
ncbi:MAG: RHS repeat-associated core domain-containing protein, partial [Planctomycetota bacterium]